MTQTQHYVAEFVESFPTPMEAGVLYVSQRFAVAGHLCPSGCNLEVVTKLSPARYRVIFDGEVSLQPSVAATALPCNSHYFITRGQIDWHNKLDAAQAVKVQASDRRAVEAQRAPAPKLPWWARIWRGITGA